MTPPNAGRTARERARAELTREIKEEARRQLAVSGADGLSLRAVARKLGMASSALYRYFASRDDLLTALIIDAYDAIGDAVEEAVAGGPREGSAPSSAVAVAGGPEGTPRGGLGGEEPSPGGVGGTGSPSPGGVGGTGSPPESRGGLGGIAPPGETWLSACRAVRAWARAHPHEYALIYGSPVPGYRAPEATIGPAARVPVALMGILRDAAAQGLVADAASEALPAGLERQAAVARAAIGPDLPASILVRGLIAWTQLYGMVSFEMFGQFAGTFDPADDLFEYAAARMAGFVTG